MTARWLARATPTDDSQSIPLGVHARIASEGLGSGDLDQDHATADAPILIPAFDQSTETVIESGILFPSATLPLVPLAATTDAGGTTVLATDEPAALGETWRSSTIAGLPHREVRIIKSRPSHGLLTFD